MDSSTPGDAETIRKLSEQIKAHRGDTEAWTRLGGQLRAHRELAGYGNRRRFVNDRCRPEDPDGLDYKFVYDLEGGPRWGRRGFPAGRMRNIAAAYGVTLASIGATLDGGNLVATPDPAPNPPRTRAAARGPAVRRPVRRRDRRRRPVRDRDHGPPPRPRRRR